SRRCAMHSASAGMLRWRYLRRWRTCGWWRRMVHSTCTWELVKLHRLTRRMRERCSRAACSTTTVWVWCLGVRSLRRTGFVCHMRLRWKMWWKEQLVWRGFTLQGAGWHGWWRRGLHYRSRAECAGHPVHPGPCPHYAPGANVVCAATLVGELGSPETFVSPRQGRKVPGMNPVKARESGVAVYGRPRQSRRGRRLLRRREARGERPASTHSAVSATPAETAALRRTSATREKQLPHGMDAYSE